MTTSKADRISFDDTRVEFYSDIENAFRKNPRTGLLARVTNQESVAQSLRNLMLTTPGERFYDMDKGSEIAGSLFESFDEAETEFFRARATAYLERYEPRAEILDVVVDSSSPNEISARITYRERRFESSPLELNVSIRRIR